MSEIESFRLEQNTKLNEINAKYNSVITEHECLKKMVINLNKNNKQINKQTTETNTLIKQFMEQSISSKKRRKISKSAESEAKSSESDEEYGNEEDNISTMKT